MNRSARKLELFQGPHDYDAFVRVLAEAEALHPMRLLCFVVMPNHWHLVLWPATDGELSRYMKWLTSTHAIRWHGAHGSRGTGAVYQGRFKAIPVQNDAHLLSVCRYVEQNPVRAGLVDRGSRWPWSSAARAGRGGWPTLHPWPVPRPDSWDATDEWTPVPQEHVDEIRRCTHFGLPFGGPEWRARTADTLGWSSRQRGRPAGGARSGGRRPRQDQAEGGSF